MYRLGIDVGGTNTDAVIMQGRNVLSGVKGLDHRGRHLRRARSYGSSDIQGWR